MKLVGIRYTVPFATVGDRYAEDPFMPEHPLSIISKRKFQPIPMIFGTVPREMNLFLPGQTPYKLRL
jgi:hypothetical protein